MPDRFTLVDEAISARASFVNLVRFPDPMSYMMVNGLSLGFSAAAAAGLQMAMPERKVVNVVGDGSMLSYP